MLGAQPEGDTEVKSGSTTFNIERDLVIAGTYIGRKTEFYPPKLELFRPPRFPRLHLTESLTNRLCQQHVLVLGGNPEVEKGDIARHLAWSLQNQKKFAGEDISVQEWGQPTEYSSLIFTIQQNTTPTIYILLNAEPRHLGFDLYRLQQLCGEHFIVASTEVPEPIWRNSGGFNPACWYELTVEGTYNPEWLAETLLRRIEDTEELVPEIFREIVDFSHPISRNLTLLDIAFVLKTPGKVDTFLQLLYQEQKGFDPSKIPLLLEQAQNVQPVLEHWFLHALSPQEQTLVMGLTLLDGLFDGQFFNALEKIADKAWRQQDPSISLPDYKDLENLSNFYHRVDSGDYGFKLESNLPGQRKTMLRVLLKYRRRQIFHALNVLVDLVIYSVQDRSVDINLYGTEAHREQIRRAVTDTLSDVDLIAGSEVESCLLRLASDTDSDVQAVAAEALARKIGVEGSEALMNFFERWQHDDQILKWMENFIIKQENGPDVSIYVKATLALAMAFSSQYQPRNRISKREVDFFRKLSKDTTPLIRDRFCKVVLPKMVPHHLKHLRRVLHELIEDKSLIAPISVSLALAYPVNANEVELTLNQWYVECKQKQPPSSFYETLGSREKLLLCVVFTHGFIQYSQATTALSIDATLDRFQEILDRESNRWVRAAIFESVSLLSKQDFEKVRLRLSNLASMIDISERNDFIGILLDMYLDQRTQFRGGDEVVTIKKKRFSIFYDPASYPLTEIEKLMFEWMRDTHNRAAEQIAFQACIEFDSHFISYEDYRLSASQRKGQQALNSPPLNQDSKGPFIKTLFRKSNLVNHIASWLFTRESKEYRPVLQNLLPEVILHYRSQRSKTDAVLARWERLNNPTANQLSTLLKSSVGFVEHSLAITFFSLAILLFVIYLLMELTNALLVKFAGF